MHAEKRNFQERDTDKENEKQNMDDNSKKMGPLEGNQNFSERVTVITILHIFMIVYA